MTTTETPYTDACPLCASTDDCFCFSEELKQAFAASKAEVERLQSGFQGSCYCCEPVGILNQKLEAEVERLTETLERLTETLSTSNQLAREEAKIMQRWKDFGIEKEQQLKRAVEIAEMFRQVKGLHYQCNCASCQMLGELKKELK